MKIAFDIGGVISKYPDIFRVLMLQLQHAGATVLVITDMHGHDEVVELLKLNDFDFVPLANIHCADYDTHGEGCKALLCEELGVDMFYDDFIGYTTAGGAPVRLLVMPDATRPYYADNWKVPKESKFGRQRYTKRQAKGRDV